MLHSSHDKVSMPSFVSDIHHPHELSRIYFRPTSDPETSIAMSQLHPQLLLPLLFTSILPYARAETFVPAISNGIHLYLPSEYIPIRIAHAVLACTAWLILFPLGGILLRWLPSRYAYKRHPWVQVFAYIVFVAAAVLGIWISRPGHIVSLAGIAATTTAPSSASSGLTSLTDRRLSPHHRPHPPRLLHAPAPPRHTKPIRPHATQDARETALHPSGGLPQMAWPRAHNTGHDQRRVRIQMER